MKRTASPKLQMQRERLKLRAEIVTLQQQKEEVVDKLRTKRQALKNMRGR